MTAKEYLRSLQRLDTMIDQKMGELDGLRAACASVGGMDYSGERVQTSPAGDAPFAKSVEKMAMLSTEIDKEVDRYIDEKHRIINQIQGLTNEKHMQVLYKRYVEFKRFEEIAAEMGYDIRSIYRIHGHALQDFENKHLREF
ncbi:MAG: hypothetical protein LUI02_04765 [Clostridiales bacterium]|nr:hypothetical protein [Clostridiales bacterium]